MRPMEPTEAERYSKLQRQSMNGWQQTAFENQVRHGFNDSSPRRQQLLRILAALFLELPEELAQTVKKMVLDLWDAEEADHKRARRLLLIIGEVSEAFEEIRAGHLPTTTYYTTTDCGEKPEGFGAELADVAIRLADLAEAEGVDLGAHMAEKHLYNEKRPYKHGKRF